MVENSGFSVEGTIPAIQTRMNPTAEIPRRRRRHGVAGRNPHPKPKNLGRHANSPSERRLPRNPLGQLFDCGGCEAVRSNRVLEGAWPVKARMWEERRLRAFQFREPRSAWSPMPPAAPGDSPPLRHRQICRRTQSLIHVRHVAFMLLGAAVSHCNPLKTNGPCCTMLQSRTGEHRARTVIETQTISIF